jgi:hypothetical protein
MKQVTDLGAIEKVVDYIIAANPDKVAQAKAKPQLAGWFVGQVIKSSGGKANPQAVNDLVEIQARHLIISACERRALTMPFSLIIAADEVIEEVRSLPLLAPNGPGGMV